MTIQTIHETKTQIGGVTVRFIVGRIGEKK